MLYSKKAIFNMVNRYDTKLRELMGSSEYMEFSKEVAKESFRIEIEELPNGEFKDFILDNFETITED